jgi:hypothetical protein
VGIDYAIFNLFTDWSAIVVVACGSHVYYVCVCMSVCVYHLRMNGLILYSLIFSPVKFHVHNHNYYEAGPSLSVVSHGMQWSTVSGNFL